jgi:hypothetical protein
LSEVDAYLADRKAKGFTTLQVQLLTWEPRLANAEGHLPLGDLQDLATPQEEFFDRTEAIVARAEKQGLLLSIAPIWLSCCEGGWRHLMMSNGVAKCRAFGQFVGRRFARFKNIVWIMGGDLDPGPFRPFVNAVAEGIRESAPHQLMTAHPGSPRSAADEYPSEPWLDLNCTYTYSPDIVDVGRPQFHVYAAALTDYRRTPTRPFVLLESAYENERNSTPQVIRRQAWWAYLSGACGHALGNQPIYTMKPGWQAALDQPGSRDMAHLAAFFKSIPWQRLVPDDRHEWITGGYGTFDPAAGKNQRHDVGFDYVTAAADTAGSCLVAYLPRTNSVTVNLGRFSQPVRVRWFDPSSGGWEAAADTPLPNQGNREFAPPGLNATRATDWVLTIRRLTTKE